MISVIPVPIGEVSRYGILTGKIENHDDFFVVDRMVEKPEASYAEEYLFTNADGEIVANEADKSIYAGFAFYARKIVNGVSHWRAIFFPKVIFTEPSESMETKKKDLAFGSHTLPGKIRKNLAGDWKIEKTFDTEAAASAWVDSKAGISAQSGGGGN